MGSIPRVSVITGPRGMVPSAPLPQHLSRLSQSDHTALVYSDETTSTTVSYAELECRTNALAKAIAARARVTGANMDGDYVIAVCMQPTHNTVTTMLAIWKAGAAYLPLETTFPQGRISHILTDAEPALVIYDDAANPAMFANSGVPAVSFEDLLLDAASVSSDEPRGMEVLSQSCSSSIAIILYTSGSTGIPKGVRIPYSAICNRLWWQFRTFPYSETELNCVWKTSFTFVDSVCEIWGPLLHGRTLIILSKETTKDPQKLVRVLAEYQIQRLVLVPTLLRSILMYLSLKPSERPLQHLKLWVCSGEVLNKDLALQFFSYFGDHDGYSLANFYGSTEVMGDVTYYVIENPAQLDAHTTIPIGSPLDNCAVYLLDEEMNPAWENAAGEVWVAGANLAAGYVGGKGMDRFCDNPHANHPDFGRLYRTGDFGTLHKGVILYTGRSDSQVKIRGHRVDLQEVERAVAAVKGVDKCVVLCYGLSAGNPEILAFVTISPDARVAARHIEAALKDSLTAYQMPQVIEIETVPLLVNGKVDRQALLKMYENTNNNDDSTIPLEYDYTGIPESEMEKARVLFTTVGSVLGRGSRGVLAARAGFYELGGNSLNSIYTITRLRDQGYYIEISDFLNASTLGEVLSHLSTDPEGGSGCEDKFTPVPMRDEHKQAVIDMVVSSFYLKAELEQFVIREIEASDYGACVAACWPALREAGLSVVLTDATDTPVAVALNFDARDEPDIEVTGGLAKIMAFLEFVEGPIRDNVLPEGKGAILHSFMMATAESLSAQDNVTAIRGLELATAKRARERGFKGVFTTNTSPLTQQLGRDVLGFTTLLDYQLNQYVDNNGERVFGEAGDDMRVLVCWKPME